MVTDLGNVATKCSYWQDALPRVTPFYAVKCNSDPRIIDTLAAAGTGFDCASKAEMQLVLARGVNPSRIVYAHPCKPASHIAHARTVGVNTMTFDNENELHKMRTHHPDAKLVMRVLVDDSSATCPLGSKFGVAPADVPALLDAAMGLGAMVVGISFHVGSSCTDPSAFATAVATVAPLFEYGRLLGFPMTLLDVGGGFPGQSNAAVSFDNIARQLNAALDRYFPAHLNADMRVIAEPGRYFVASACVLAVNVTAKRTAALHRDYYVNDGIYGSLNCIIFDHQTVVPQVLLRTHTLPQTSCTVWGPTCDSIDCISKKIVLPELNIGDWLVFENMGAYTTAASSTFNGFARPSHYYV